MEDEKLDYWLDRQNQFNVDRIRWKLYKDTDNFCHLMAIFCEQMERLGPTKYEPAIIPHYLLWEMYSHFSQALNAESDDDARMALGVGKKKGGPAQRLTAKNQYKQTRIMDMLDSMKNGVLHVPEAEERFEQAAELTGYTKGSIRTLYYSKRRIKKKR